MDTSDRNNAPRLEDLLAEAEDKLRSSIDTLNTWSDQAQTVLNNRPGVLLGALAVAGFMTGLMARKGSGGAQERSASRSPLSDPFMVFLTGAVAGVTMGPRVLRELSGAAEGEGRISRIPPGSDRFSHH